MIPHILLVDDEVSITKLLELDLTDAGYRVTMAHDGFSGWHQAHIHNPDLVVLDWQLPHLTGLEVCARLRAAGKTMPIIFTTAFEDRDHRTLALAAGANDYLVKPFGSQTLIRKIVTHLRLPQPMHAV